MQDTKQLALRATLVGMIAYHEIMSEEHAFMCLLDVIMEGQYSTKKETRLAYGTINGVVESGEVKRVKHGKNTFLLIG